jgi:hypothetical protein
MNPPTRQNPKIITLCLLDQDDDITRRIPIPCYTQDNLFSKIIFYSEFAKWEKVTACVGPFKIHVYNSSYNDRRSAMDNLEYVLSKFWDTRNSPEMKCTVYVREHDYIPPTDGPPGEFYLTESLTRSEK